MKSKPMPFSVKSSDLSTVRLEGQIGRAGKIKEKRNSCSSLWHGIKG